MPRTRATIATATLIALATAGAGAGIAQAASAPRLLASRFTAARLPAGTELFGAAKQGKKTVLVGESGAGRAGRADLLLVRLTPSGALDRSFGHRGLVNGPAIHVGHDTGSLGRAVAVEPNGKIVVVGEATDQKGVAQAGLLIERFDRNGSLDRHFGHRGVVNVLSSSYGTGYGVALARGGKILAAGSAFQQGSGNGFYPRAAVVRLDGNGRLDRGFGSDGVDILDFGPFSTATAMATAPNGRIAIAGSVSPNLQATESLIARLTSSGRLDRGFAGRGYAIRQLAQSGGAASSFDALLVQRNGELLAGGSAITGAGPQGIVARFTRAGGLDGGFGSGGVARVSAGVNYTSSGAAVPGVSALTLYRGALLASGTFVDGVAGELALWRFTGGGHLHSSSVLRLAAPFDSQGSAIALAGRGKVLIAGSEYSLAGAVSGLIARLGA